jgi:hypothetical protein
VRIARFAPVAPASNGAPDPARWAVRLAEALLEVLAGLRPLTQLERWLSPTAMSQVAQSVRKRAARDRPTLFALHLHQDTAHAVEVAAVYGWPDERCAMAFRISAGGQGWVCTALTLPPPKRRSKSAQKATADQKPTAKKTTTKATSATKTSATKPTERKTG